MPDLPPPPDAFVAFTARYPALAQAWADTQDAGTRGPLDAKTQRLVKLAIAVGAMRPSAVRSAARKAKAAGVTADEVAQVVALAAGTLGFPAAVAIDEWVRE